MLCVGLLPSQIFITRLAYNVEQFVQRFYLSNSGYNYQINSEVF